MRHHGVYTILGTWLMALGSAGCAESITAIRIQPPTVAATACLSDLRLPPGTDSVVRLGTGETVRGTIERNAESMLQLYPVGATAPDSLRRIPHDEVVLVARVVKNDSKRRRGWIGAAIAAAVSVPFGISMVGDMVIPAAIVGALIGRSTARTTAQIVFDRAAALKCNIGLALCSGCRTRIAGHWE